MAPPRFGSSIPPLLRNGIGHQQPAPFRKSGGIEEPKRGGAIAHDDRGLVVSQTPAFALVLERAQPLERAAVVDKPKVRLPGELKQLRLPERDAFAEVLPL